MEKSTQQKKSIAQNAIFNLIKTVWVTIFPLVTFSFASRVLGVDGIGKVSFVRGLIIYFVGFAGLGVRYYATREAAKLRDDKDALSKFSHEMLIINSVSTLISYIALYIMGFFIETLNDYRVLLLINSPAIFLSAMGMEWLYQALEEYKFIAIRAMGFQVIALLLMLCLVRSPSDINIYAALMVLASYGFYIINIIHSRKYITFNRFRHYDLRKHLKGVLLLFAMALSIELYTVLDSTMLGFIYGNNAVGLYSAAIKVNKTVNTVITSIGVVFVPRLSYYFGQRLRDEFTDLMNKAYQVIMMLSVPAFVGLFILSKDIILLFCGEQFLSASVTMRILTPIVIVIPFSIVTNLQVFLPMGKEKLILLSTCVGAVTNFSLNMLLIPCFAENGAAIATVIAETAVTIICYINARKHLSHLNIFKEYFQYWIAALPIVIIGGVCSIICENSLLRIAVVVSISAISYFVVLLLFKNKVFMMMLEKLRSKIYTFEIR